MAVGKTFVCDSDPTRNGLALTYVVPTVECDLKCGFCYIRQRREAARTTLRPVDYVDFLDAAVDTYPVRVSGLQGYEPLIDDSWTFTRAILARSLELGIPTSMVTNGTHLRKRVPELVQLGLRDLTVSLDASAPEVHDRIRGVKGAFKRTVKGIEAALCAPVLGERLAVSAVLIPGRRDRLDDMPRLLAGLGVRYFGVTPLLRIGAGPHARIVQEHDWLIRDLDVLGEKCGAEGITFVVDDEMRRFRHLLDGANRLMIHSLERPNRLVRLTPSGACSVGLDVLARVGPSSKIWSPGEESAREFFKSLALGSDFGLPRPESLVEQ